MKGCVVLLLLCCGSVLSAGAQQWSAFGGAGITCDAFVRDKSVPTYKNKWPVHAGAGLSGGVRYATRTGFDAFLDAGLSLTFIQYPAPEVRRSQAYFSELGLRLMAGTGPRLPVGSRGNTITPFLKLGAVHFNIWDETLSDGSDEAIVIKKEGAYSRSSWNVVCGAGLDWRFEAAVPSAIGLQFNYTPLNVLREPIAYTVVTKTATYDLALQGKILQVVLSYSVHWKFKQQDAGYD